MPAVVPRIGPVAISRLDSDYYASTRFCLEQTFDHVIPGEFVIVDDYGCYEGCRTAVDKFLAFQSMNFFFHHADPECGYIQKALHRAGTANRQRIASTLVRQR